MDEKEVFERLKNRGRINATDHSPNDDRGRSLSVAVLLVLVVLLSSISGIYAGASFSPLQPPNYTITTTVYTTTTSWTTLTTWFTETQVVLGVLTTTTFTTSTSTVTVIASTTSAPTIIGTSVTITQTTGASGVVSVKGVLRDATGKGLQGLQLRVTVDARYAGRVVTGVGGSFAYTGSGPTAKGTHVLTVWFDKTTQYAASAATVIYKLL